MSLYAIGDLHLAHGLDKPMDVFGQVWANHEQKLIAGFESLTEEDLCVLCGDLSWGMGLEQSKDDFAFINALPGKKIILKGNHDYWWTTVTKIRQFFDNHNFRNIEILNNNCFFYNGYAICGTRGWFYEEENGTEQDVKIMNREIQRLKTSLEAAGECKKLVFLHYPPVYLNYRCEGILKLLREYEVKYCWYGHLHGHACQSAFNGWLDGTCFRLVSADHLHFQPWKIDFV